MPSRKRGREERGDEQPAKRSRDEPDAVHLTDSEVAGMLRVGPFLVDASKVPARHIQRLWQISDWYTPQRIRDVLVPFATQSADVSLRAIDWFVTNWTKRNPILAPGETGDWHSIAAHYKRWLRHYRRRLFDPFRRHERILFEGPDGYMQTTCAQANFLKWAHDCQVLSQARCYRSEIEADMLSKLRGKRREAQRRRSELTPDPGLKCQVYLFQRSVPLDLEVA